MAEAEELDPQEGTHTAGPIEEPLPETTPAPAAPAYNREQLFADYEKYKQMGEEMFQKGREHLTRTEQIAKEQPSPAGTIQAIDQELAKMPEMPKPPDLPRVPRHEDFIDKTQANFMKAIGNVMIAANIGGSRIRGTRAMNAMAASINGFVEGNNERAAQALQEYDREVRAQALQYQNMSEWYRNVLATSRSNIQARMQQYEMQARAWGDKLGAEKAVGGDIAGMMNHADALAAQSITLMNHLDQLDLQKISKNLEAARLAETIRYHKEKTGAAGEASSKELTKMKTDIVREARQEVSAALPKDQLGNVILGPEWGTTIPDRTAKFEGQVNRRARELARMYGQPNLFGPEPQTPPKTDPIIGAGRGAVLGGLRPEVGGTLQQEFMQKLDAGQFNAQTDMWRFLVEKGISREDAVILGARWYRSWKEKGGRS